MAQRIDSLPPLVTDPQTEEADGPEPLTRLAVIDTSSASMRTTDGKESP